MLMQVAAVESWSVGVSARAFATHCMYSFQINRATSGSVSLITARNFNVSCVSEPVAV